MTARYVGGWASTTVVSETYAHADVHDPAFHAALRRAGPRTAKADPLLPLNRSSMAPGRQDRLELLTALIDGPAFDPLLRAGVIRIPARHRLPLVAWWLARADPQGQPRDGLCPS